MSGLDKVTPMMAAALEVESTSPAMASYIENLVSQADPNMAVGVSIRKALINELDSKKYPETAGRWPKIRKAFRAQMAAKGGKGLSSLGDTTGGSTAGAIVGAVGEVAGTVLAVVMQKYQMDQMRKEERKQEAAAREAAEKATQAAQAEATRNALMARLAARTGGMSTVGQTTAAAQQIATENTTAAIGSMARQEMAVQQQIDNKIVAQGNLQTAAMVAVPVGAMMMMR